MHHQFPLGARRRRHSKAPVVGLGCDGIWFHIRVHRRRCQHFVSGALQFPRSFIGVAKCHDQLVVPSLWHEPHRVPCEVSGPCLTIVLFDTLVVWWWWSLVGVDCFRVVFRVGSHCFVVVFCGCYVLHNAFCVLFAWLLLCACCCSTYHQSSGWKMSIRDGRMTMFPVVDGSFILRFLSLSNNVQSDLSRYSESLG